MIAAPNRDHTPLIRRGLADMMASTEERRRAGAYEGLLGPDISDYRRDRDLPMIFGARPIGQLTETNIPFGFELVAVELIRLALRIERKRLKKSGLPTDLYYRRIKQLDEATMGESRIRAKTDAKLRMKNAA